MWCWLSEIVSKLMESNLFIFFFAIIVATLLISNIYSALALGLTGDDWETGDYHARTRDGNASSQPSDGPYCGPWNNQSPINIETSCVVRSNFENPLIWSHYNDLPVGIRLENNGHSVLLRAAFRDHTPFIDGGDLLGKFDFHEISFRWSWHDGKGSEHTVNHQHFPLEMQCLHTDTQSANCASSQGLLMISYMFKLADDNPYLDPLVQHLAAIQTAGQCVELPPFPLSYLILPFYSRFFSYHGSLTEPPYHRGVEWFLWPFPLAISERQLNEFRQLRNRNGSRINWNGRPVQQLHDRNVIYNIFQD